MPTPSYEEIAEALYEVSKILAREMDPGYNYVSWENLDNAEQDVNIAAAEIVFGTIEDRRVAEVVARDIEANSVGEQTIRAEVIAPYGMDEAFINADFRREEYAQSAVETAVRRLLQVKLDNNPTVSFKVSDILTALWNQAYNAGIDNLIDDCESVGIDIDDKLTQILSN